VRLVMRRRCVLTISLAVWMWAIPSHASVAGFHGNHSTQLPVETRALPGMPVRIDSAALENIDGKISLTYRITNQPHEGIKRVHLGVILYLADRIDYLEFSLDNCKLAPGSTIESSRDISGDLSQVTRMLFTVLLAQSDDNVWFIDSADYYRFRMDVLDVAARSKPNLNCWKVTKKALYPYLGRVLSNAPDPSPPPLPDSCTPQLAENPPVDTKPVVLNNAQVAYTAEARKYGIDGRVKLRVLVVVDGSVSKVIVLSGLPDGLSEAAARCAEKFAFQPATKNGQPVAFWQSVDIEFQLR
jgi:TonB family protein